MSERPRVTVRVLATSYGDGNLEIQHDAPDDVLLDIHLVRVPVAFDRTNEGEAEACAGMALPRRFTHLWPPLGNGFTASTLPLAPSVAAAALATQDALDALNKFAEGQERTVWTL